VKVLGISKKVQQAEVSSEVVSFFLNLWGPFLLSPWHFSRAVCESQRFLLSHYNISQSNKCAAAKRLWTLNCDLKQPAESPTSRRFLKTEFALLLAMKELHLLINNFSSKDEIGERDLCMKHSEMYDVM
jgi:hypothetical protein